MGGTSYAIGRRLALECFGSPPRAALVAGGLVAGPALGHFDSTIVTRIAPVLRPRRTDPINVVFTAWGTWGRAESQIAACRVGLDAPGRASLRRPRRLLLHAHPRASGLGRVHAAFGASTRTRSRLGGSGALTRISCSFPFPAASVDSNGSAVAGSTRARRARPPGRRRWPCVLRVWWGNTQSFKQCDGDYAASDGWTVFVELHQVSD